jgi:hypothetical protein
MTESRAIGDCAHILLEKERVHALQRELLPPIPKSPTRYARADFATQLEPFPKTQYHRAVHHRLHLPGYQPHIDRRCQKQTVAPAHCIQYWTHFVIVRALTTSAGKAPLATVNLFVG